VSGLPWISPQKTLRVAVGLVVALSAVLMPPAGAEIQASHGYTIANGVVRYSPATGIDIGGYRFAPNSHRPFRVVVADLSRTATPFEACQDTNGDGQCGGPGEPSAVGCGDIYLAGFDRYRAVSVLVALASVPTVTADCLGAVGTTGVITVSYSSFG
jgi:hypothetical protein